MSSFLDLYMYCSFISTVRLSRDACPLEPPVLYLWVCTAALYLMSSFLYVDICCSLIHCPFFQAWTYTTALYVMSSSVDLDRYCRLIINVMCTINMHQVFRILCTYICILSKTLRPLANCDCRFESHRGYVCNVCMYVCMHERTHMHVCMCLYVCMYVRWRSLRQANHSSGGVLSTVMRRCV